MALKLRPTLERQGITYHPALFRQANFIEHAVGNVTHSLLVGALLVALVLGLGLVHGLYATSRKVKTTV